MAPTPIALLPALPSELLTYILASQDEALPTTVIICQPRPRFLSSLLESINTPHASSPEEPPILGNDSVIDPPPWPPLRHPLLIPTLHQIATSRRIHLVFIPTLSHLRAYLVTFAPQERPQTPGQPADKPGERNPLLVVYGLIELHCDTSEWSAQGLGNSLAGLVQVGSRSNSKVVVIERRESDVGYVQAEEGDDKWKTLSKVWEQRVPVLNGSGRRRGLDGDDVGWSGRTIEVGNILGRWFKFGKGDWVI